MDEDTEGILSRGKQNIKYIANIELCIHMPFLLIITGVSKTDTGSLQRNILEPEEGTDM
jgi:hypothetical protein